MTEFKQDDKKLVVYQDGKPVAIYALLVHEITVEELQVLYQEVNYLLK